MDPRTLGPRRTPECTACHPKRDIEVRHASVAPRTANSSRIRTATSTHGTFLAFLATFLYSSTRSLASALSESLNIVVRRIGAVEDIFGKSSSQAVSVAVSLRHDDRGQGRQRLLCVPLQAYRAPSPGAGTEGTDLECRRVGAPMIVVVIVQQHCNVCSLALRYQVGHDSIFGFMLTLES